MLKQRVVTALVLVIALFLVLFCLPAAYSVASFSGIAALAAWEWSRLLLTPSHGSVAFRQVLFPLWVLSCCGLCQMFPEIQIPLCEVAAIFWLMVPLWLARRWPLQRRFMGFLVGSIVIIPAWIGMVKLQATGPWTLLAVMALVWIADISAYFVGRAVGRHKLAPSVSPGKTWEGVGGAVGGGLFYVFMLHQYGQLSPKLTPAMLIAGTVLLVIASIVGDLFESMIKRQCGVKDSSQLLPGHGGVLDRIDSLTSTMPLIVAAVGIWPL